MPGISMHMPFFSFFIVEVIKETVLPVAINVAFNKTGTKSDSSGIGENLFDGNLEVGVYMDSFSTSSTIEIYLGESYMISHIIIYSGEGNKDQLDHFGTKASEDDVKRVYFKNGIFPDVASFDIPSRVNIEHGFRFVKIVQIAPKKYMTGVNITEIEVYSFDALRSHMLRGCFGEVSTKMIQTEKKCVEYCFKKKKIFAALMGSFCECLDKLPEKEVPLSNCFHKCKGEVDKFCGGVRVVSLYYTYIPLPHFDYCHEFGEKWNELEKKNKYTGNITVDYCLHHCQDYDFTLIYEDHCSYLKLKFDLSGDTCSCENFNVSRDDMLTQIYSTAIHDANAGKCNFSCSGDPDETCGGDKFFSLYKTCQGDHHSNLNCTSIFHCIGHYDKNGVCVGGCQPGFHGEHCIEIEVDECILKPCDSSEVCQNTVGSYICNCKPGFTKSPSGKCFAVEKEEASSFLRRFLMGLLYLIILTIVVGAALYGYKQDIMNLSQSDK